MRDDQQVLRFAVGSAGGPRSRTWRLWVPKGKSDVYISGRTLGNSVKVSLHEPGPARFALTSEWVRRRSFRAPEGRDRRLAKEWDRPRPRQPRQVARPFTIIVPFDEVISRERSESGEVVWITSPAEGACIHFDVVYTPAHVVVTGHPGARSMGTKLVGDVQLANGERVFVTWIARPMTDALRRNITILKRARFLDGDGQPLEAGGMLCFGLEQNQDANDGTYIGVFVDVTRQSIRQTT